MLECLNMSVQWKEAEQSRADQIAKNDREKKNEQHLMNTESRIHYNSFQWEFKK